MCFLVLMANAEVEREHSVVNNHNIEEGELSVKAREIMTRNVATVREDVSIYEAMRVLISEGITGLPVITRDGDLSGIVTEKDMLTLLNNPRIDHVTAGHLMTRNAICFDENDNITDINNCLKKNHFRRCPFSLVEN